MPSEPLSLLRCVYRDAWDFVFLANIRLITVITIENYFCSIEPCMLLCFKNNIIAREALMQFAETNNDRMCVTVFF